MQMFQQSALFIAAKFGHEPIVSFLIEKKAQPKLLNKVPAFVLSFSSILVFCSMAKMPCSILHEKVCLLLSLIWTLTTRARFQATYLQSSLYYELAWMSTSLMR